MWSEMALQIRLVPDLPGRDRERCLTRMIQQVLSPELPPGAVAVNGCAQEVLPGVARFVGAERGSDRSILHPLRGLIECRHDPDALRGEVTDDRVGL